MNAQPKERRTDERSKMNACANHRDLIFMCIVGNKKYLTGLYGNVLVMITFSYGNILVITTYYGNAFQSWLELDCTSRVWTCVCAA